MNAAIESDDAYPFLRDHVAAALADWQSLLAKVINRGIDSGEFPEFTDANRLANLLIASIEGALMMSRLLNDLTPMQNVLEHLKNQVRALSRQTAANR